MHGPFPIVSGVAYFSASAAKLVPEGDKAVAAAVSVDSGAEARFHSLAALYK